MREESNQERIRRLEAIQNIQANKLEELEQNLVTILHMVTGMATMDRVLADQEETRREVEQN